MTDSAKKNSLIISGSRALDLVGIGPAIIINAINGVCRAEIFGTCNSSTFRLVSLPVLPQGVSLSSYQDGANITVSRQLIGPFLGMARSPKGKWSYSETRCLGWSWGI